MGWKKPRSSSELMSRSRLARYAGFDGKVLRAIGGMVQAETGIAVVVPPWRGTEARLQVSHPAQRKLLAARHDDLVVLFNQALGREQIRRVRIEVQPLAATESSRQP